MINSPQIAVELLAWYADAGIDVGLHNDPVDRFAQAALQKQAAITRKQAHTGDAVDNNNAPPTVSSARFAEQPARTDRVIPDAGAVARAVELATNATTLEELRLAIEGFEGCNLKFTARTTVFGDGNADSGVMLVGEVPDRDEDERGVPFVGKPGQLFEKMLAAIGLERSEAYLSCILPWRPPGNRAPSPAEVEICRPFIERHIELVNPGVLVTIGGSPSQILLQTKSGIMSARGKWATVNIGSLKIPTLPMLHPNYLLRNQAHKRLAWNDLLVLKSKLLELASRQP